MGDDRKEELTTAQGLWNTVRASVPLGSWLMSEAKPEEVVALGQNTQAHFVTLAEVVQAEQHKRAQQGGSVSDTASTTTEQSDDDLEFDEDPEVEKLKGEMREVQEELAGTKAELAAANKHLEEILARMDRSVLDDLSDACTAMGQFFGDLAKKARQFIGKEESMEWKQWRANLWDNIKSGTSKAFGALGAAGAFVVVGLPMMAANKAKNFMWPVLEGLELGVTANPTQLKEALAGKMKELGDQINGLEARRKEFEEKLDKLREDGPEKYDGTKQAYLEDIKILQDSLAQFAKDASTQAKLFSNTFNGLMQGVEFDDSDEDQALKTQMEELQRRAKHQVNVAKDGFGSTRELGTIEEAQLWLMQTADTLKDWAKQAYDFAAWCCDSVGLTWAASVVSNWFSEAAQWCQETAAYLKDQTVALGKSMGIGLEAHDHVDNMLAEGGELEQAIGGMEPESIELATSGLQELIDEVAESIEADGLEYDIAELSDALLNLPEEDTKPAWKGWAQGVRNAWNNLGEAKQHAGEKVHAMLDHVKSAFSAATPEPEPGPTLKERLFGAKKEGSPDSEHDAGHNEDQDPPSHGVS